jgi:hypothetical protein
MIVQNVTFAILGNWKLWLYVGEKTYGQKAAEHLVSCIIAAVHVGCNCIKILEGCKITQLIDVAFSQFMVHIREVLLNDSVRMVGEYESDRS